MKVLDIVETIVDGPHLRTSIYFAGCSVHCDKCHNQHTWDFNQGTEYNPQSLYNEIQKFGNKYISLSGGNPIEQPYDELMEFTSILKNNNYNIWLYSGNTLQQILSSNKKELLYNIDALVDGPYIEKLKDEHLKFRGSSNQNIWDIKESLKHNKWIKFKLEE